MVVAVAYSKDLPSFLRERALRWMASGRSISRVSRLLDVSRPTLYKWRNQAELHRYSRTPTSRPPLPHQKNSGLASISRSCGSTW
ncbi:MAG: hypothetical protein BRC52_00800 [Cyanobacteria bacterium SW_5_48_44]|nr:MAG: hypothetical protein BRC52_00800 [Cyanobacteria bacterium SW_5_48_44]